MTTFDFSRFTQPALTTVRLSRSELADKALEALTAVIGQKTVSGREFHVGTKLIVRESTRENREKQGEFPQMPEGISENEHR
jgi:DNA-binding LacI/PurR family transcriptional regulator